MLVVMFDAGYQKGELMITRDDIVIRKAILHILDTDRGDCILSSALLNPGPEMHDFIRNHIYKIVSSDDTKNCVFDSEFSTSTLSWNRGMNQTMRLSLKRARRLQINFMLLWGKGLIFRQRIYYL